MREQAEVTTASSEGIKNGTPVRQRRQWSQEEKRRLVEQWKQSGESISKFSRKHRICYSTFVGWSAQPVADAASFVEVSLASAGSVSSPQAQFDLAEIVSPNGWRIRLPREIDSSRITQLLNLIAAQC